MHVRRILVICLLWYVYHAEKWLLVCIIPEGLEYYRVLFGELTGGASSFRIDYDNCVPNWSTDATGGMVMANNREMYCEHCGRDTLFFQESDMLWYCDECDHVYGSIPDDDDFWDDDFADDDDEELDGEKFDDDDFWDDDFADADDDELDDDDFRDDDFANGEDGDVLIFAVMD